MQRSTIVARRDESDHCSYYERTNVMKQVEFFRNIRGERVRVDSRVPDDNTDTDFDRVPYYPSSRDVRRLNTIVTGGRTASLLVPRDPLKPDGAAGDGR